MQELWDSIKSNRTRSVLTGLGIAWGVMILIVLVGIGKGFEEGVMKIFTGFARKTTYISSGQTSNPSLSYPAGRTISFSLKDIADLQLLVPGIKDISPQAVRSFPVSNDDKTFRFDVNGVSPAYFKIRLLHAADGRVIDARDLADDRKVAFIGEDVARYLFGKKKVVGQSIAIGNVFFTVIGVIQNSLFNTFESKLIYIPYSTFTTYLNKADKIGMVVLSVDDDASPKKIEDRIRSVMGRRYNFSPNDPNTLFFNNLEQQVEAFTSFFEGLTKFLWFMGLSTLFSGIIGVTNIMYCVARERTKEIGLRKAVGAKNSSIRKLFISEAILLTSIAGFAGMVIGSLILKLIGYFMNAADKQPLFEKPVMDWHIALAASLILIFAGTAAGFMPAIFASRLNPIEALRQE